MIPKTKIICTLGPASSYSVIRMMMREGMDCVRLNFSHGTHDEHKKKAGIVRELNKKYRRHIRILGDLEGFRMRVGNLKKPVELRKGEIVWLTTEKKTGEGETIPFDCSAPLKIKPGYEVYMDDGNIALRAIKVGRKGIKAQVMRGGLLKGRKGVNIPQADIKFPPLTEKDRRDIRFAVENRFDYLAQSFVRDKRDILRIKELVKSSSPECKVIAKVENRTALENIDEIIEVSDGIMIARGDLGISIPVYQVPVVQKEIVRKCKEMGKFVIVATQMLESMTEHPLPTRAEVSDVANAVFDGADAVMLSAETAVGKYPVETVRMMNQIIKFTEKGTPASK